MKQRGAGVPGETPGTERKRLHKTHTNPAGIVEAFFGLSFPQPEMFVRYVFGASKARSFTLIRQRVQNPNCLRKGRRAGVSLSHDRWVEVKTLIVAFGGGSDSLSYLPFSTAKTLPPAALLVHRYKFKEESQEARNRSHAERFGAPS